MHKFKVLAGKHSQKEPKLGPDGKPVLLPDGSVARVLKTYKVGDIVETPVDLVAKFNQPSAIKFERITAGMPAYSSPIPAPATQQTAGKVAPSIPPTITPADFATLESMTFAELKKWAEGEEIDLKNARTKEEALKVLKSQ